jgi:tetratricopeptide (TPR) repeat protein
MIERVLAESPEDPEALQLLTYAYLSLDDLDRALPCAERCVAACPEDGTGHRYRASILAGLGRFDEARQSALAAVELSPEDVWAHYVLVDVLLKSSGANEAREAAGRLLALAPEWSSAHESMGRVALEDERHEEAEAHLKKALEIDPESAVAMNNLGAVFLQQKRHGEAVRFFWNALRSRSRSPAVQYNLRRALVGYFAHSFFLAAALAGPPVLLISLKAGVVTDEERAFRVFWIYCLVLGTAWVGVQILRHRSLPLSVRNHLWRAVHLPFWAGLRDLVVFCGIVSSFFHGIYLYLWWSRGSHWAPGSALTWRLFVAFTFWILTCYLYVISEWIRRRRLR